MLLAVVLKHGSETACRTDTGMRSDIQKLVPADYSIGTCLGSHQSKLVSYKHFGDSDMCDF